MKLVSMFALAVISVSISKIRLHAVSLLWRLFLLDYELGFRRTFFSRDIIKLSDGIRSFDLSDIFRNIQYLDHLLSEAKKLSSSG